MTYSLTNSRRGAFFDPPLQNVVEHINNMPQISHSTVNLLKKYAVDISLKLPTQFSKTTLSQKASLLERSIETADQLESNRLKDQYKAVGRAAANISCLMGIALFPALSSNYIVQIAGALGSLLPYAICGALNMEQANNPRFIDEQEDGGEVCFGFCFGPCFAGYEALRVIPHRIELAENAIEAQRADLYDSFLSLNTFCQKTESTTYLRNRIISVIADINSQLDSLNEIHLSPVEIPTAEATAPAKELLLNQDVIYEEPMIEAINLTFTDSRNLHPDIEQGLKESEAQFIKNSKTALTTALKAHILAQSELDSLLQYVRSKSNQEV